MNLKIVIFLSLMMTLPSCTEFAMITSGAGVAGSHNAYSKAYSGVDILTIISTEKDIKTHLYETLKEDK